MSQVAKRVLIVATVLFCTAIACAQGGGGGRQGRMGRGNNFSEMSLAMRKDVQADLAVTDDQKLKLDDLRQKQAEARRASRGQGGPGGGGGANGGGGGAPGAAGGGQQDRAAMQARMQQQTEENHKALAAILSDAQMARLGEISIQLQGNAAILSPTVQKQLSLTDDQKRQIKTIQTQFSDAQRALRQQRQNNEVTPEAARQSTQDMTKARNDKLAGVLTPDQVNQLKALGGKPFTADPPSEGGGF